MKATGAVLFYGTVYYTIQTGSYFRVCVDSVDEVLSCANVVVLLILAPCLRSF